MRARRNVLRPNAGAETIDDIVGDLDGVLFVLELDDRQDGAEDFLLGDAHLVVDAGEDRRLDKVGAAAFGRRRRAAAEHALCAFALGDVDVAEDLLILRRRRHGADLRLELGGIAELGGLGEAISFSTNWSWIFSCSNRREPAMQVWPDAAKMPEIAPLTASSMMASSKTMFGDLPPSSSETFLNVRAAISLTRAPVALPPVNATLATFGMRDKGLADDGAGAGDDVDDTGRDTGRFEHEADEFQASTPR